MSIKLSREKIKRMIDTDAPQKSVRVSNSSSGGGSGSGGGESVNWWQYSPTDDTVTFLKRIASAVFDRLRITTKLIFGNSDDADTYVTGIADDNTAETSTHDIVTPNYGKEKYLSREHDDVAQGWITILEGIRTLETFLEGAATGGALFTDSENRAQLVADVAKIRDKVLGSLTIEEALSVLGSLNVHNSSSQGNTFADGTTISNYIAKLNGNARIDETLVALAGMYVNVVKSMNYNGDGPFDAGWMMTNNKNGHSYLVVDELFVRMKAIFTELEIRKISYAGGDIVFSHAGSKIVAVKNITKQIAVAVVGTVATITGPVSVSGEVLNIEGGVTVSGTVATLNSSPVTYAYRCYAMKDDGTTATENWWRVNDQARCQTFNIVEPGVYQNAENTYYWRRVLNTGYEKIALTEGQTEENYDYVDLSVVDCDTGSDAPKAGDSIVQMGNRTDTDRMGFISLEVSGDDAPAIKVYKNVNGYTLNNKRKICISPKYTELHLQKMVIETEYDAQPVAMERGPWDEIPGHRCYYYNVVQHNGSSWLCIYPEEGIGGVMYTTEEPSENATYWQYYAKAGKDGKDGKSFNIQGTVNSVSELPPTGVQGQAWIVKIDDVGHLYVWDTTSNTWKDSGQIQGDPGRGIQSVTVSYGNSDSPSTLPATWGSTPSPEQGKYLWTRTILNYTDGTESEPSYSVSYNGTDGTSPIMIAVDNPIMSVACDKDGHALAAFSKTVVVSIYDGNDAVGLTAIDCTTATGIAIQNKSVQNRSFKIVIAQGAYIDQANNLTASASAVIDGETFTRTIPITVNGIRQGYDGMPASKVELSDYMVDIEVDENGNATQAFSEEISYKILAGNSFLYPVSVSVGTHANVTVPSYYYISPTRHGVMSISGNVATINGVSSVSGSVATLPSTVVRLPHIFIKASKGGSVTEGNVSINITGLDSAGRSYSAGNYFAVVRNYYAPALQVVLSPEVLILTQNEQTKQIDLSTAYTDIVMRIGGTDITSGLGITAEVSQVEDRPTCSASVNGNRVSITAINTTATGSGVYFDKGYIDIHVSYQGNVYTQRFSFYCNLLGTWKETVENDTKTAIAQSTLYEFTGDPSFIQSTQKLGEFIASSSKYETKLTQKVIDSEGNVITTSGSLYQQTATGIIQRVGNAGITINQNSVTLAASKIYINNGSQTAAMFENGKIKGQYLQVGGFTINSTQIKSDNDKIVLNKVGTATIGKMSVDANGNITATDVDLTGKITATSGEIGGFTIGSNLLYNNNYAASISVKNNASNPTQVVVIGKDAVDAYTGSSYKCSMQAEATGTGTYNTALYLNAQNGTYNYAFHGNGNGVLNGFMAGFRPQIVTIPSGSGDTNSSRIFIREGNFVVIKGSHTSGGVFVGMPTLTEIRSTLGISSSTPFFFELNVISFSTYEYVNLAFRGATGQSGSEYPVLMGYDDRPWQDSMITRTSWQIAQGDYFKIILTYIQNTSGTLEYRAYVLLNLN